MDVNTRLILPPVDLHRIVDWPDRARRSQYRVRKLAQNCGVSQRRLERFFKKTRGLSPQRWLNLCRQAALEAMLQDRVSVKEVAYATGYKHPSHLSRQFREAHGVSPSLWRNQHSANGQ